MTLKKDSDGACHLRPQYEKAVDGVESSSTGPATPTRTTSSSSASNRIVSQLN